MLDTPAVNTIFIIHLETTEASDLRERIRDAKQRLAVSRDDADRKKALVATLQKRYKDGSCQVSVSRLLDHPPFYKLCALYVPRETEIERERGGGRETFFLDFC